MVEPYPAEVTRPWRRARKPGAARSAYHLPVTPPHPIELYRLAGSHRDVGNQMGELGADRIRREIAAFDERLPTGRTRAELLDLAQAYRDVTAPSMPWLIQELDACAEGAGVDALEFFATTIEELWYAPYPKRSDGRCSDVVAGPAATADGHLWVGHNNDLRPEVEPDIVAIEKAVAGEPVIFQIGGVPWISVGWNQAGLSLTGNELSPNDERVGISRAHQVFEMLRARNLHEMVAMAIRPDRASSYNNVLADRYGDVANVEGSATDVEIMRLDEDDHLAHTNHYVSERMQDYEGDPDYAVRSDVRYCRARDLLAGQPPGSVTPEALRTILSDHENPPNEVCRHPEWDHPTSKTVFWSVADVTEGRILYGRGNPCDSMEQEYVFAGYGEA
jgi:isopenicillin-N N-acyltransferase-like protein